jgi:CMP/dCMP kinase
MISPVVTVDGPGGAGKGTLCAAIAYAHKWHLLDSGAIYRLLGLKARQSGVALEDIDGVQQLARELDITFQPAGAGQLVTTFLDGADVSNAIRTETAGTDASVVAANELARAALLERQRNFRKAPGLIADGRDMGTVVFRDAELKIFLTASVEERAARRYKQLIQKGVSANVATLSAEIAERDRRDRERVAAPMVPADDAIVLDTTGMPIDAVVEEVQRLMRARDLS